MTRARENSCQKMFAGSNLHISWIKQISQWIRQEVEPLKASALGQRFEALEDEVFLRQVFFDRMTLRQERLPSCASWNCKECKINLRGVFECAGPWFFLVRTACSEENDRLAEASICQFSKCQFNRNWVPIQQKIESQSAKTLEF